MLVALKARYAQGYAFLPQVRNATGVTRVTRTADALAMGLWPSMGIELLGFELKSSRTDWLKELSQPEKSEEIGQFCHRWWMVFGGPGIYRPAEDVLPAGWGAMQATEDGRLTVIKDAPLRQAQAPTWSFVASVMRSMARTAASGDDLEIERNKAREEGRRAAQAQAESRVQQYSNDYTELFRKVRAFETATGVSISQSYFRDEEAQKVAFAVIRALAFDPAKVVSAISSFQRGMQELQNLVGRNSTITDLQGLAEQLTDIQKGFIPWQNSSPDPEAPASSQAPETTGSGT